MELLFTLNHHNLVITPSMDTRIAIRAIIYDNDELYLIKSKKYQEYKFLGGGSEKDENHLATLKREAEEEGGIVINDEILPFGYVIETRKSKYHPNQFFLMYSYYYFCTINHFTKQQLKDYEIDYEYYLEKVEIKKAIENNYHLGFGNDTIPWNQRETMVLELLKAKKLSK